MFQMISGVHTIVYSQDADRLRSFFRDVLEFPSVDAGRGWLIFALPPGELAVHPTEGEGRHELYLMCDDIQATVAKLKGKGIELAMPVADRGWGSGHAAQTAGRRRDRPLPTQAPDRAWPG